MGANIKGAGTDTIRIRGVERLHGSEYSIIPDQIEAGTYMIAAAATGGDVYIRNVIPKHLEAITAKLIEIGAKVEEYDDCVRVHSNGRMGYANVKTMPYPGFPTDMQPQMVTLLALSEGVSIVTETIFETRFKYISELRRNGINLRRNRFQLVGYSVLELVRHLDVHVVVGLCRVSADDKLARIAEIAQLDFKRHAGVELVGDFLAVRKHVQTVGVEVHVQKDLFAAAIVVLHAHAVLLITCVLSRKLEVNRRRAAYFAGFIASEHPGIAYAVSVARHVFKRRKREKAYSVAEAAVKLAVGFVQRAVRQQQPLLAVYREFIRAEGFLAANDDDFLLYRFGRVDNYALRIISPENVFVADFTKRSGGNKAQRALAHAHAERVDKELARAQLLAPYGHVSAGVLDDFSIQSVTAGFSAANIVIEKHEAAAALRAHRIPD